MIGFAARTSRSLFGLVVFLVVAVATALPAPAHALSGTQYNNTLPYPNGCGQGAYVITSKNLGQYGVASMVYSPRCQTNWMEWYATTGAFKVSKSIAVGGRWTTVEVDKANWSYGRQMYAPGNTTATGIVSVAMTGTPFVEYKVTCSSSCTWKRID